MVQDQGQEFRFRCPSCGHSSDVPAVIPESQGIAACPWCGLTVEEGQRALNDELSRMFNRGMQLSGVPAASGGPISSATVTALGFGSGGSGGGGGGGGSGSGMGFGGGGSGPSAPNPAQGYTGPAALPSTLGYNVSQHYHHSTHIATPSAGSTRPVSAHAALGGSSDDNGGGSGGVADMQMDADAPASARSHDGHQVEPYMKSGYEYLAERDYNRQAQGPGEYAQALDPAFSSKEWWRDFHAQPIEFQYGMFQQMSEGVGRENEAPQQGEDEHMVL